MRSRVDLKFQWMESVDHGENVNRGHPKSINDESVNSNHYPPTAKDLGINK